MDTTAMRGSRTVRKNRILRSIAATVLVAFVNLSLQPLAMAIQADMRAKAASPEKGADEKYAQALEALKAQAEKVARLQSAGASPNEEAQAVKVLRTLAREVDALDGDMDAHFDAIGQHLERHGIAAEIKQRHEDAKRLFKDKQGGMKRLVAEIDAGDDANDRGRRVKGVGELAGLLTTHSTVRRGKLDPNNLPWRTPKSEVRAPVETEAGFKSAQFGYERVKVAGPVPPGTAIPAALAAAPTPADLAETVDVQITPAIRAKAEELGKQPLAIYQWVRNNVEFFPSYGSVQGSDDTLAKLRGNAFDTASLLIALLRASDIPARYVIGTIDVPAAQAMNWAGGVGSVAAAQQVMGQGGIPTRSLVTGGQVSHLRMEHIWVEAWVDYVPSRGAKQVEGDTWIPLDASFKQYSRTTGLDIRNNVPLDSAALLAAAQQGATVSATDGSVQNLNLANIRAELSTYQDRVSAYVAAQKPEATVGDVIGVRAIVADNDSQLAGSLANRVVVAGARFATLPDALRHKFTYTLYASDFDRSLDSPLWSYVESLPSLAGKKLTIAFRAATPADAALIASYIPKPHADGSPPLPSEIPRTLPSYANVVPELRLEGQVVASGGALRLGTELVARGGFTQYDFSGWDLTDDGTVVAGQISALGLSIQGISQPQAERLKTRLEDLEAALDRGETGGLDAERFTGDVLTATLWGYFAGLQGHRRAVAEVAGMVDREGLSYGLFHATVQPIKLFGFVLTGVKMPGVLMDVGHLRSIRWAKNGDRNAWIAYNRMRGQAASTLEHVTPERFFVDASTCNLPEASNPDPLKAPCAEGMSAIKAIGVATAQGQRIYTITQANQHVIGSLSLRSDTIAEIASAVAAGKEVTVHERPITYNGWSGAGYIVLDPGTGAGGYMIEGAANGGAFAAFGAGLLGVIGMFLLTGGIGPVIFAAFLISLAIHLAVFALIELISDGSLTAENAFLYSVAALSLVRALGVLLPALGIVFAVPGGVIMGAILVALALLGFYRLATR